MKEKPITFTAPMVLAILEGRKTQTRIIVDRLSKHGRITEFQRSDTLGYDWTFRNKKLLWNDFTNDDFLELCPYGQPGDRLWVKEAFEFNPGGPVYDAAGGLMDSMDDEIVYRADRPNRVTKWTPSIHMPRWASRINLQITGIRVERVQDISAVDCWVEGIRHSPDVNPIHEYMELWQSLYGPGAWDKNPWVWVVEFKRVEE